MATWASETRPRKEVNPLVPVCKKRPYMPLHESKQAEGLVQRWLARYPKAWANGTLRLPRQPTPRRWKLDPVLVRACHAASVNEKERMREAVIQACSLKSLMAEEFGSEVEWDKPKVSRQLVVLGGEKPARKSPSSKPRAALPSPDDGEVVDVSPTRGQPLEGEVAAEEKEGEELEVQLMPPPPKTR